MKAIHALLLGVVLTTFTACSESDETKTSNQTEKPAQQTQAASTQTATQAKAIPAQQPKASDQGVVQSVAASTRQAQINPEAGPLGEQVKAACACQDADCASKALDDMVAKAKEVGNIEKQGQSIARASHCILSSGLARSEFVSKMRTLR